MGADQERTHLPGSFQLRVRRLLRISMPAGGRKNGLRLHLGLIRQITKLNVQRRHAVVIRVLPRFPIVCAHHRGLSAWEPFVTLVPSRTRAINVTER